LQDTIPTFADYSLEKTPERDSNFLWKQLIMISKQKN